MLKVTDLKKTVGKRLILSEVSFSVEPGEIMALLGPNGAGKTTTLRILTGLIRADSGSVLVHDRPLSMSAVQTTIGYLPDEPFLYPKLSGREFLYYVASIRRLDAGIAQSRVSSLTEYLELTDALDRLLETYSLGMKRKLALCAALIHEPEILIMDEPLNGMDPKSIRRVKDLLKGKVQVGHSILFSTHLLDIAQTLCDSVAIIDRGRIAFPKQSLSKLGRPLEEQFLAVTSV